MASNKSFTDNELNDAKKWDLPFVEDASSAVNDGKTNALNFRSDWKYEPPEEEQEVKPPTAQEIEAIRQAAYEEGYAEGKQEGIDAGKQEGLDVGLAEGKEKGYEEGLAQALEEGKAQVDTQIEVWQQLIEKLHAPLSQANDETRDQLVKLAVTLAKSVIRTEVVSNEKVILQALSEGMKALPIQQSEYQINMHPDDIALVTAHFGEDEIAQKKWVFISSPTLERGGCDIVTIHNAVDVSVERRCRDVIDRFLLNQGLSND